MHSQPSRLGIGGLIEINESASEYTAMETPISQMESQCKQRHTEIVTCSMHAHTKVSRESVLHLHVVVHGTEK